MKAVGVDVHFNDIVSPNKKHPSTYTKKAAYKPYVYNMDTLSSKEVHDLT